VNTLRLVYKNQSVNAVKEIIAVCSQIHINTRCGQNVELMNVKPGVTYSDHWDLKGRTVCYAFFEIKSLVSSDVYRTSNHIPDTEQVLSLRIYGA